MRFQKGFVAHLVSALTINHPNMVLDAVDQGRQLRFFVPHSIFSSLACGDIATNACQANALPFRIEQRDFGQLDHRGLAGSYVNVRVFSHDRPLVLHHLQISSHKAGRHFRRKYFCGGVAQHLVFIHLASGDELRISHHVSAFAIHQPDVIGDGIDQSLKTLELLRISACF